MHSSAVSWMRNTNQYGSFRLTVLRVMLLGLASAEYIVIEKGEKGQQARNRFTACHSARAFTPYSTVSALEDETEAGVI